MNWSRAGEIATWVSVFALIIVIVALEVRARRKEGWRDGSPPPREPLLEARRASRWDSEDEIVVEPEALRVQREAHQDHDDESHFHRPGRAL